MEMKNKKNTFFSYEDPAEREKYSRLNKSAENSTLDEII